jgi:hypothetical protein
MSPAEGLELLRKVGDVVGGVKVLRRLGGVPCIGIQRHKGVVEIPGG